MKFELPESYIELGELEAREWSPRLGGDDTQDLRMVLGLCLARLAKKAEGGWETVDAFVSWSCAALRAIEERGELGVELEDDEP